MATLFQFQGFGSPQRADRTGGDVITQWVQAPARGRVMINHVGATILPVAAFPAGQLIFTPYVILRGQKQSKPENLNPWQSGPILHVPDVAMFQARGFTVLHSGGFQSTNQPRFDSFADDVVYADNEDTLFVVFQDSVDYVALAVLDTRVWTTLLGKTVTLPDDPGAIPGIGRVASLPRYNVGYPTGTK